MKITKIVRENKIGSFALVLGLIAIITIPIMINVNSNPFPSYEMDISTSYFFGYPRYGQYIEEKLSDSSFQITCTEGNLRTTIQSVYLRTNIIFNPTELVLQYKVSGLNISQGYSQVKVYFMSGSSYKIIYEKTHRTHYLDLKLDIWYNVTNNIIVDEEYSISQILLSTRFGYQTPVGEKLVIELRMIRK